jgi:formylglycine-generating enzyme
VPCAAMERFVTAATAVFVVLAGACSAGSSGETNPRDASMPLDGPVDALRDGAKDRNVDAGNDATIKDAAQQVDQDAGCTPNTQRCSGSAAIETCSAAGHWGDTWLCASGTCSDGNCTEPSGLDAASCAESGAGITNCGEAGVESCCASLEVSGGTYYRSYGSDPDGGGAIGESYPASVSGFRLDRYDVTVGRFRRFVSVVRSGDGGLDGEAPDSAPPEAGALDGGVPEGSLPEGGSIDGGIYDRGWVPAAGSGKHVHLNGGQGLVNAGSTGGFEMGWQAPFDVDIVPSDTNLSSCSPFSTWTVSPSMDENLPINCVNWYEAYAFCIWDGGFLPSEAEWEFAAAGGGGSTGQREYPWGAAPPGSANEYAIYGCFYPAGSDGGCTGPLNVAPVGSAPLGAGAWGQMDLGGEMYQWNLDEYTTPFTDPCVDCAYLTTSSGGRVIHGGDFYHSAALMLPTALFEQLPAVRNEFVGFRCARAP